MTSALTPAPTLRHVARADGFWLAVVLALLSCLPVVVARYPQMSDYPAHLARYYVMLDGGRNPMLARYYSFEWQWTGNVGVDLLIRPFAALFGLEGGGRIIVGLIPPLTGFGILAVEWVLRRRIGVGSLLAFAFIWSPMMLIGLLNYALGQALALWAFAAWVALAGKRWRWGLFLPLGMVVWLCHVSAWGLLGVMVAGYEWSRRKSLPSLLRAWPLALPLAFMLASRLLWGAGTSGDFAYGAYWWVYKQAIWLKAMRDTAYPLDFLGEVAVMVAIGAGVHFRKIDGRLGWAALALAVLSLVVPRHISGGDYADYRMVTASLMLGCLAIDWQPTGGFGRAIVLFGAPALYLARLAVTTLSWQGDSATTGRLLQALDAIPRGSRVASAVLVPGGVWELNHFEHIGAYAVLRRDALVNSNFALPHVHMLHLKVPYASDPSHRLLLKANQRVELAAFQPATDPAAAAQYLWYVGGRGPDSLPVGARVIWRGEDTLVAQLRAPVPVLAAAQGKSGPPLAKPGNAH